MSSPIGYPQGDSLKAASSGSGPDNQVGQNLIDQAGGYSPGAGKSNPLTGGVDLYSAPGLLLLSSRRRHLRSFGADPTGTTPATLAIQNALTWARDNRGELFADDDDRYLIDAQIVIELPARLRLGLSRFVTAPSMTSGVAVIVRGQATSRGTGEIEFGLQGPYGGESISKPDVSPTGTLDGIQIGGTAVQTNNVEMKIWVEGFRRNTIWGPTDTWIIKLHSPTIGKFWQYGLDIDAYSNAGEGLKLNDPVFYNGQNAAGNALCINMPHLRSDGVTATNSNLDVTVNGGSMDYCDKLADIQIGVLTMFGTYYENNTNTELASLKYNSGRPRPQLSIYGGRFKSGMSHLGHLSGAESADGRPALFKTDGAVFCMLDGVQLHDNGKFKNTELVSVTGTPLKLAVNVPLDSTMDPCPFPSEHLNECNNPSFGVNTAGWSKTEPAGVTVAWDGTDGSPSNGCAKFTGAGTSASVARLVQRRHCKAGQLAIFNATIKTALTAGSAVLKLDFYGADTSFTISSSTVQSVSGTAGWTKRGGNVRVPKGAMWVDFVLEVPSAVNGTAQFDSVQGMVM